MAGQTISLVPPKLLIAWKGHLDSVSDILYVNSFQLVISAGQDQNVKAWKLSGDAIGMSPAEAQPYPKALYPMGWEFQAAAAVFIQIILQHVSLSIVHLAVCPFIQLSVHQSTHSPNVIICLCIFLHILSLIKHIPFSFYK